MKTDKEIIEDRQKKYGPPDSYFEIYAVICKAFDEYALKGQKDQINYGHLTLIKIVLLKLLRSVWNPELSDNYCDARNYITFAENLSKKSKNSKSLKSKGE